MDILYYAAICIEIIWYLATPEEIKTLKMTSVTARIEWLTLKNAPINEYVDFSRILTHLLLVEFIVKSPKLRSWYDLK